MRKILIKQQRRVCFHTAIRLVYESVCCDSLWAGARRQAPVTSSAAESCMEHNYCHERKTNAKMEISCCHFDIQREFTEFRNGKRGTFIYATFSCWDQGIRWGEHESVCTDDRIHRVSKRWVFALREDRQEVENNFINIILVLQTSCKNSII